MKIIIRLILTLLVSPLLVLFSCRTEGTLRNKPIRVLILSGSNNHEWQRTTPYLETLFNESGSFDAIHTEQPDTLKGTDIESYDVIVSNWNSWPETDRRWPGHLEKSLIDFIRKGGGFVTFHASASAFYSWPEFKKISTGAWVQDSTWHGKNSITVIQVKDRQHPITRGFTDFLLFDELWIDAGENDKYEVLATGINGETKSKGLKGQPVALAGKYGEGNLFHLALGHDVRAMRNPGFQALLLRGTEWAATGEVSQPLPFELTSEKNSEEKKLQWQRTDSTVALYREENLLWQYNFNTKQGRPFFHPVYIGRNNMTCVSPEDHPWHLGQWFCWKYINGVNYWEYRDGTFQSDGLTEIENIEITTHPDFSAEIAMNILYHPRGSESVLSENRQIKVSSPQENGNIWMDYEFNFEALADTVLLDRTPIEGEPNGQSWGGYAGLSIRFSQSLMDAHFISQWKDSLNINGRTGDWLYMGFTGPNVMNVGSQIMIAPSAERNGAAWYSVVNDELPFYYFSPAYLYKKPLLLLKHDKIDLKYRVLHIHGETEYDGLEKEFENYKKSLNQ